MKNEAQTSLKELSKPEKENILSLILQSDIRKLRQLPISTYNLNFLYPSKFLDIKFDKQITPLLLACYIGKIDIFLLLINNDGIDINQASEPENYSPLMISCFKGFYEIVRILLEKNANLTYENKNGQLAFIFCFSRIEQNSYRCENKKICMMLVDLLLDYGADINSKFDKVKGYTILMKLVSGDIKTEEKCDTVKEIMKFLLERGADTSIKGNDGVSIFDIIKNSEYIFPKYKEQIIDVIKETKQLFFFFYYSFLRKSEIKGHYRSLTGVPLINKANGNEVIFETNEDMNCCRIF